MIFRMIAAAALVALCACGADGPPLTPTANIGVGIGPNGLTTSTRVGATSGNVGVTIGL